MSARVFVCSSLLIMAAQFSVAHGQSNDPLALISPDAVAVLTVQPPQLVKSKAAQRYPLEVLSAAGLEYLKFDPLQAERIDVILGIPVPGPVGVPVAICITHSQPISQELIERLIRTEPVTERGIELWPIPDSPDFVVAKRGTNQVLIGPKLHLIRLLRASPRDGELRKLATSMQSESAAQLIVALEPLREMLTAFASDPNLQSLPEVATNLALLAEKTKLLALRLDADEVTNLTFMLEGNSAADTPELGKAIKQLVMIGFNTVIAQMEQELPRQPGKAPAATLAYLKRLSAEIETSFNLKVEGNRLTSKFQQLSVAQTGILVGLLLPAVQASREAARRMQSMNNMKQLSLSMWNYESAYRSLPNDRGPTKSNPNLSWRVHLLPFLEQNELHSQFHLDEPWDSPHNIKLLEQMPPTFRNPSSSAPVGYTTYHMPAGKGMVNNQDVATRMSTITDGTANTVGLIVTNDQAAVPWTKPEDIDPLERPDALIVGTGVMMVGLVDGSIHTLVAEQVTPEVLKALLTISGGEVVDMAALK